MGAPFREDTRLGEAQAIPIEDVAERLGILAGLTRVGREWTGPCPSCGGKDRFALNTQKNVFLCRHCEKGDGIALVRLVLGCDFPSALQYLCDERTAEIDPQVAARRKAQRDADQAKRDQEADHYRQREINAAHKLWEQGEKAQGTPVRAYLTRRGIRPDLWPVLPPCLRFHPDMPYFVSNGGPRDFKIVHRGPAMMAAIQGPDDHFCGLHITWIDPSRLKGKALITHNGDTLLAKKMRGSKKGGAIRLRTGFQSKVLVMAEGIENTALALCSGTYDGAQFWAGCDLGNMSGRRESGQGLKFAGRPDMSDRDAFVPPAWVEHLIFIKDGDSDPRLTDAKLRAGLRRAMILRPGLRASMINCPSGSDLGDLAMEGVSLDGE